MKSLYQTRCSCTYCTTFGVQLYIIGSTYRRYSSSPAVHSVLPMILLRGAGGCRPERGANSAKCRPLPPPPRSNRPPAWHASLLPAAAAAAAAAAVAAVGPMTASRADMAASPADRGTAPLYPDSAREKTTALLPPAAAAAAVGLPAGLPKPCLGPRGLLLLLLSQLPCHLSIWTSVIPAGS
jgi:hypothetical protein